VDWRRCIRESANHSGDTTGRRADLT
jgi:hypothetical protein